MTKTAYNYLDKQSDYIGAMQAVDKIAYKAGVKPEIIALQIVKENIPTINRYILEHGEVPEKNPIALAAQATLLHEGKIWDKIENGGIPDYEAAERQVLAEEQLQEEQGEVSSFVGSILGVVSKAGNAALPKINKKRVAAGKRPLLAGEKGQKLLAKINRHVQLEAYDDAMNTGNDGSGTFKGTAGGIFLNELANEVERQKTMEAVKKYLPFAIIAIIIIIYIARKTK